MAKMSLTPTMNRRSEKNHAPALDLQSMRTWRLKNIETHQEPFMEAPGNSQESNHPETARDCDRRRWFTHNIFCFHRDVLEVATLKLDPWSHHVPSGCPGNRGHLMYQDLDLQVKVFLCVEGPTFGYSKGSDRG